MGVDFLRSHKLHTDKLGYKQSMREMIGYGESSGTRSLCSQKSDTYLHIAKAYVIQEASTKLKLLTKTQTAELL
jgi:hypothetical protein